MKQPEPQIPMLLAVCAAACLFATASLAQADSADRPGPYRVVDSAGHTQVVVATPSACAPFVAEAVWGRTLTLAPIGYRCFSGMPEFRN